MEAGVVCMKVKLLVGEIWPERVKRVHHRQEFQEMGGVVPLWQGVLARFKGHRVLVAVVILLLQDGSNCQFGSVCDE